MVLFFQSGARALRQVVPLALLGISAVLLWPMMEAQDAVQLGLAWHSIAPGDWILAAVFTAISFFAIGQYDVIAHRQLDTGLPAEQARQSGMAAIAISQTVGFGLFTATLARWRLLRGFGPGVATLVTAFVSLSILTAMVSLTALACLLLPTPRYLAPVCAAVLPVVLALICIAVRHPRVTLRGVSVEFPSLRAIFAATGWAALDMGAACVALWILIPEAARPEFLAFLPVFCLALCAGLLSGTPAGAGPFELVLLALCAVGMPAETNTAALLVGVIGFRVVYFALPAILAAIKLMIRPERAAVWRDPQPPALANAPRAETAVIRQNGGCIERMGATHAALWPTGQALVAIFDPFDPPMPGFFACLATRARERNRFALIYKGNSRTAAAARKAGWISLHSADDAVVDVARFDLGTPARAGLRRKLRKVAGAGVTIRPMDPEDAPRMAEIDAEWQAAHGRARGGTMGRFCMSFLDGQHVLLAEAGGRIVAYVSFHTCRHEWTLDLVRQGRDAPDGTMHALVHAGLTAAAAAGTARLCLAAVPACPDPDSAFWRHVAFRVAGISRSAGLRQFKSSFAPRWQPLYMIAPSRLALLIAGLDVAREVLLPTTLPARPPLDRGARVNRPHDQDEINELAPQAAA